MPIHDAYRVKIPLAFLCMEFKMAASTMVFSRSWVISKDDKPRAGLPGDAMEGESLDKASGIRRILLVDDNADLLEMAAVLFEDRGFEVWTATTGIEAMETLRRVPEIDVLFTDIVMPGMNGFQLAHEAVQLRPPIRVILVSGYPNPADQTGANEIHDFDFISKPYRIDDVLRLLAKPN
jgi:CheY-like chemotaxis protein